MKKLHRSNILPSYKALVHLRILMCIAFVMMIAGTMFHVITENVSTFNNITKAMHHANSQANK